MIRNSEVTKNKPEKKGEIPISKEKEGSSNNNNEALHSPEQGAQQAGRHAATIDPRLSGAIKNI